MNETEVSKVRKLKLFLGLGLVIVGTALSGMINQEGTAVTNQAVEAKKDELVITEPASTKEYVEGTYRIEGVVTANSNIKIFLDNHPVGKTQSDGEGLYVFDVPVEGTGKHVIAVQYKNSKEKLIAKKLEFKTIVSKETGTVATKDELLSKNQGKEATNEELPEGLLPEDSQDDVKYPIASEPDTNEEKKPQPKKAMSSPVKTKVKAPAKTTVKPVKKVGAKKPTRPIKVAKFGISSHANFNVIPKGVITLGGRGKPGDKILVLVDGKAAMRGTIKPNGRWAFPINVKTPGGRVVKALNLSNGQNAVVKLKIK